MTEWDGVLKAQYEVHCFKCQHPVLGLGSTVASASAELIKDYGWKRVKGKWHCPVCTRPKPPTPQEGMKHE